MPRITPSSHAVNESIEPDEFYEVSIKTLGGIVDGKYGKQLQIDLEYEDGSTTRDWLGLRLGKLQNGTVAKLRQMLNSIAGKPHDAEIAWFDSDNFEWSYEKDGDAFDKLTEGRSCLARGIRGTNDDDQPTFTIDAYRALKKATNRAAGTRKMVPAGDVDPDDVPF